MKHTGLISSALLLRCAGVVTLALCLVDCQSCDREQQRLQPAAVSSASLAPVPAPVGLVGRLRMAAPKTLWSALLQSGGLQQVPVNLEVMLAAQLGLSPLSAGQFAVEQPIAALLLQQGSALNWVWAVKLHSGAELIASLTRGQAAAFEAVERGSGQTLLRSKTASPLSLAVIGQHLLVAGDQTALLSGARYLVQSLSQPGAEHPSVELTLEQAAISAGLVQKLRRDWQQTRALWAQQATALAGQHGRKADLAEPAAVLDVISAGCERAFAIGDSISRIQLQLTPTATGFQLDAELTVVAGGAAEQALAGFRPGTAQALGGLPLGVRAALLSHRQDEEPAVVGAEVKAQAAMLFGARVGPQILQRVEGAFSDLARGLDSPTVWGLLGSLSEPAVFLTARVGDRSAFERGMSAAFALLSLPAFELLLQPGSKALSVQLPALQLTAHGRELTLATAATRGESPTRVRALWLVRGDMGYLVVGTNAEPALSELLAPAQTLDSLLGEVEAPLDAMLLIAGSTSEPGRTPALSATLSPHATGAALRLQGSAAVFSTVAPWVLGQLAAIPRGQP